MEEAETMTAAEFARSRLGFRGDGKQEAVLNSGGKRGILNCSRQWGKSTVTAAKAVHRAYMEAQCLVLVASPSERQSGEFLRKAAEFLRRLGIRPRGDGDNAISLMLPNGSRIATPESDVKGAQSLGCGLDGSRNQLPQYSGLSRFVELLILTQKFLIDSGQPD